MEPLKIDVGRARREAKDLLAAARKGDPEAVSRFRANRPLRLADAQHAVARSHGYGSWPELVKTERSLAMSLLRAARIGDDEQLYELLEAGAPPNARDPRTGRTALHVSAVADQLDTVSVLVTWVRVDLQARDRKGRTALDLARPGSPVAAVLTSCNPHPDRPPLGTTHAPLMDEADVALLDHLSRTRGVERQSLGDGFTVRTGLADNSRNGVVCRKLPAEMELEPLVQTFSDLPARWYVGPQTEPADLRSRLERVGCQPERNAVHMAARLDSLTTAFDPTVEEAIRPDDLLHLDRDEAELLAAAGPPLRHFIIPGVGGITTFVTRRTLLGINLEVRRPMRRQGHARTLVRHAAAVGTADGCTRMVLAPTAATIPFLQRLGFELERSRPDHWYYLPIEPRSG